MELKKMTIEELETLSFTDIAYLILKEQQKSINTPNIFKKVCKLLKYSDEEYASKIGDFYTSLTTDKRFILLDNAQWDLRDNHKVKIVVDEDDEEDGEVEEIVDEIETEEESEDIDDNIDAEINDDDLVDDDMEDLEIVDEDEELEED